MGWIVRLNGKGRIVIPNEVRDRFGLKKRDVLVVDIRDNEIILITDSVRAQENSKIDDLKHFLSSKES